MMEKRGVIEEGITPPEDKDVGERELEDHVTKRAADIAHERLTPPPAAST